ncbi:hypothetical protein B5M47_03990 [candidate division CPR3 bacterium 4484_211]|uniref:HTH cro/C1-type domain-containing protein n=1 Tax=candidate division CPR3 bacterium 4484_211 TaxID=1968527 RepID=A0A1W9NVX4_UNCC3|nr:MAG: hypothetical protein B5M47_03990 [candidate division CPR3 bacterium 4484_211]
MAGLREVMERFNLSAGDVAHITGYAKSTISQIKNNKYNGDGQVEAKILKKLVEAGYRLETKLSVRRDVFIKTGNVRKFDTLCDELLAPQGDLTSSIGVVMGRAGRGKTKSARHYAVQHSEAVYVLFIDGFSLVDVAREIAFEIGGIRPRTFRACLDVIDEATLQQRRLIIIDEADKMPKRYFEMLRGLNERCACPIVLVGEEPLRKALDSERRLKSRVRQMVVFEPVLLTDIAAYYQAAIGITVNSDVLQVLWQRSQGDFRLVVRDAFSVVRIMNTNRLSAVTMDVVKGI